MNKNIITVKALSTGVFLGGIVLANPAMGADIDFYTSSLESTFHQAKRIDMIEQPVVSFDCNAETEISIANHDDSEILNKFAESMLSGMKSLDSDISQWVDENFWDLI